MNYNSNNNQSQSEDNANLEFHLNRGLVNLIQKIREDYKTIAQPYGKNKYPSPLISEDEFINKSYWKQVIVNELQDFNFKYGFNPVRYLAEYLQSAHPAQVELRNSLNLEMNNQNKRLCDQKLKRDKVVSWFKSKEFRQRLETNISWGLMVVLQSDSSVLLSLQLFKKSYIHIDLSYESNFNCLVFSKITFHDVVETENCYPNNLIPYKVIIENLDFNTEYHIRYASTDNGIINENTIYLYKSFFSPKSTACKLSLNVIPINKHFDFKDLDVIDSETYSINCLLGDPICCVQSESSHNGNIFYSLYAQVDDYCNGGMILCWNDSRVGSDKDLLDEEISIIEYRDAIESYKRKLKKIPKVLSPGKRPPDSLPEYPVYISSKLTESVHTLSQSYLFSLQDNESIRPRSFYKRLKLSAEIEVFVLDSRNAFLGESQCDWLFNGLVGSKSKWKIIFSSGALKGDLYDSSKFYLSRVLEKFAIVFEEANEDPVTCVNNEANSYTINTGILIVSSDAPNSSIVLHRSKISSLILAMEINISNSSAEPISIDNHEFATVELLFENVDSIGPSEAVDTGVLQLEDGAISVSISRKKELLYSLRCVSSV